MVIFFAPVTIPVVVERALIGAAVGTRFSVFETAGYVMVKGCWVAAGRTQCST